MKKFLIILCILFVIAAITVVLLNIKQKREMVGPMFRAVPLDAAIIIDVADYNSLKDGLASNKPFYDGFLSMSFLREIRNELKLVDSLSGNNNVLANILNQQHPLMITGHPYKKDELQFLYYFRVNTSEEFETIDKTIKMSHGIVIGSSRTYESATIQDMVLLGTRNEGFSYSWVKGILIIGRSSILLEDAIRQLGQKDNILSHNGLNEILKTAGKTAFLNVFLNFEHTTVPPSKPPPRPPRRRGARLSASVSPGPLRPQLSACGDNPKPPKNTPESFASVSLDHPLQQRQSQRGPRQSAQPAGAAHRPKGEADDRRRQRDQGQNFQRPHGHSGARRFRRSKPTRAKCQGGR